jgi:hypothetical protein
MQGSLLLTGIRKYPKSRDVKLDYEGVQAHLTLLIMVEGAPYIMNHVFQYALF